MAGYEPEGWAVTGTVPATSAERMKIAARENPRRNLSYFTLSLVFFLEYDQGPSVFRNYISAECMCFH